MLSGGGIKSRFLVDSKSIILRTRYRSEVGQLFSRRYDPLGPLRAAHPTKKYLHPPGTPLEKNRQKITIFGNSRPRDFFRPRWPSEVKNGFKHVLWTFKHLLWCLDDVSYQVKKVVFALENWSQNDPRATFPLGFRGKTFKNIFCPKLHQKTLQVLAVPALKPRTGICTH